MKCIVCVLWICVLVGLLGCESSVVFEGAKSEPLSDASVEKEIVPEAAEEEPPLSAWPCKDITSKANQLAYKYNDCVNDDDCVLTGAEGDCDCIYTWTGTPYGGVGVNKSYLHLFMVLRERSLSKECRERWLLPACCSDCSNGPSRYKVVCKEKKCDVIEPKSDTCGPFQP